MIVILFLFFKSWKNGKNILVLPWRNGNDIRKKEYDHFRTPFFTTEVVIVLFVISILFF